MKDTYIYYFEGKLYINLTNRCSNDCTFCIRNNMRGIDGNDLWLNKEGTKEEIVKLISECEYKYDEAVFCGYGESTYRLADMLFIADYLHSIGKRTRLDTNGLGNLINGTDIVPLLVGKIDHASISLNEYDAEKYDKVSRSIYGEQAFDAMIEFTKECIKAGIDVLLTVVDVIDNEDIIKCRNLAEKLGARFRVRSYIK